MRSLLTRRTLLQKTGYCLAAAATSRVPALAEPTIGPEMLNLSTYMARAAKSTLPASIAEQTKLHLLDTLAAMISGAQLLPGRKALAFLKQTEDARGVTVATSSLSASPIEAALINGMLAHSDETDDSHAPSQSHPGCAVVPAAMATGETYNICGPQFLAAIALGYDVGCRVTMALGASAFQIETHRATHSIAGTFGAAAAAGCVVALGVPQMRWLLDYAAQQASGIASWQRDPEHIEKAFTFGGMPARNGVTAALAIAAGWSGVDDVFSGPDNFLVANNPKANAAVLSDKLGERYEIARTNIKKWCVGSPIQAPLDAMELLMQANNLKPEQVRQVAVSLGTEEAGIVNNRDLPDICLQHLIALLIVDGTVTFRSAHDLARMKDPEVLRQRDKVRLIPSEELQRELPKRVAIVDVTLVGGIHLSQRIDAVRGTAENPMSEEEIISKARDLMAPTLGTSTTQRLIDAVLHLHESTNIHSMTSLLRTV